LKPAIRVAVSRDVNKDQAFKANAKDLAFKAMAKDLAIMTKAKSKARTFRCNQ